MSSHVTPLQQAHHRVPAWSPPESSAARRLALRGRSLGTERSTSHPKVALVDELSAHPLFASSQMHVLEALCADAKVHELAADRVIFDQGQPAERVYVLMSGAVTIYHNLRERRLMTALLGAPSIFGDREAILHRSGHLANAMTLRPTRVISIAADDFRAFISSEANGARRILADICQRDACVASRESSVFHPIATRLASLLLELLELARQSDPATVRVRATHEALADALGVTSKSIARTLQDWGRNELVHQRRGSIVIDPVGLEAICPQRFEVFHTSKSPEQTAARV